jgi:hypothetical protein
MDRKDEGPAAPGAAWGHRPSSVSDVNRSSPPFGPSGLASGATASVASHRTRGSPSTSRSLHEDPRLPLSRGPARVPVRRALLGRPGPDRERRRFRTGTDTDPTGFRQRHRPRRRPPRRGSARRPDRGLQQRRGAHLRAPVGWDLERRGDPDSRGALAQRLLRPGRGDRRRPLPRRRARRRPERQLRRRRVPVRAPGRRVLARGRDAATVGRSGQ